MTILQFNSRAREQRALAAKRIREVGLTVFRNLGTVLNKIGVMGIIISEESRAVDDASLRPMNLFAATKAAEAKREYELCIFHLRRARQAASESSSRIAAIVDKSQP